MKMYLILYFIIVIISNIDCKDVISISIFQTSQFTGDLLTKKDDIYWTKNKFDSEVTVLIDSTSTFQQILGFGGAFTEAGAYTYSNLNPNLQNQIVEAYFGKNGIGYSLCRMHIGSCDFCLETYNYDNVTDDFELKNFDISHDSKWLIPFIQDALSTSSTPIKIFGTPWSPPGWMKQNGKMLGSSTPGLINNTDVYKSWALYLSKYITEYQNMGIDIWGMTIQNEPENNYKKRSEEPENIAWETCVYDPQQELDFLVNYLGPRMKIDHPDLVIMIYDHNKNHLPIWVETIMSDPIARDFVQGSGFHWYSGSEFDNVLQAHNYAPDKFLLATEACNCPVNPGNWENGENYGYDIIGDLNNWSVGWVDWNMVLDINGGPSHTYANCDSPILADLTSQNLTFNPSFYYMGQFSSFIKPGSYRIGMEINDSTNSTQIYGTSFLTPQNETVIVLMNQNNNNITVQLTDSDYFTYYTLLPHSIVTFVYNMF